MFAVDVDGIESGPLSSRVSFATGRLASKMHGMLVSGLLCLIALHVAAVLFYLFYKRTNLIIPMLSGSRNGGASEDLRHGSLMRALLLLILSAAATWSIVTYGG